MNAHSQLQSSSLKSLGSRSRATYRGNRAIAPQSPHPKPRIMLYSHDTMGLGHKRRNLLIAQAIGRAIARLVRSNSPTGQHKLMMFLKPAIASPLNSPIPGLKPPG